MGPAGDRREIRSVAVCTCDGMRHRAARHVRHAAARHAQLALVQLVGVGLAGVGLAGVGLAATWRLTMAPNCLKYDESVSTVQSAGGSEPTNTVLPSRLPPPTPPPRAPPRAPPGAPGPSGIAAPRPLAANGAPAPAALWAAPATEDDSAAAAFSSLRIAAWMSLTCCGSADWQAPASAVGHAPGCGRPGEAPNAALPPPALAALPAHPQQFEPPAHMPPPGQAQQFGPACMPPPMPCGTPPRGAPRWTIC